MDYYKRYMGDYGKRTARLSMLEHGAYTLLLDDYYSTEAPLPAEPEALYRICRAMTKAEQMAVMAVANQFFPIAEDGLRHQQRVDEELAEWAQTAERSRTNGRKGGRPKNPVNNPEITQWVSTMKPTNNPVGSSVDNPEEKPNLTQKKPSSTSTSDSDSESSSRRTVPEAHVCEGETQKEPSGFSGGNPLGRLGVSRCDQEGSAVPRGSPGQGLAGNQGELNPGLTLEQAQQLQAAYPRGIYRQSEWLVVQKLVNTHLADGVSFERILASFDRYRLQCEARKLVGGEFVQSPVKHCDREHPQFDEPFPLPATKAEQRTNANIDAAAELKRQLLAGRST